MTRRGEYKQPICAPRIQDLALKNYYDIPVHKTEKMHYEIQIHQASLSTKTKEKNRYEETVKAAVTATLQTSSDYEKIFH